MRPKTVDAILNSLPEIIELFRDLVKLAEAHRAAQQSAVTEAPQPAPPATFPNPTQGVIQK